MQITEDDTAVDDAELDELLHIDSDDNVEQIQTELTFQFPQPETKKLAIVGFAGGHHFQAPFSDDDVEIWGINRLWKTLPDKRWTRWFELHDLDKFYRDDDEHKQFLRDFAGPVYVREQDYPLALEWGIETAQPFPHRVLLEQFNPYFTNTVSWLLGLAIMMDYEWVGVYGVDMAVDNIQQAEYCVAPDTRVLTSGLEWRPADTVRIGDTLVGFDEQPRPDATYREYKASKVTNISTLTRPCYRLEMADGTKLVSSQEHRWLTNYGNQMQWMTTDRLHPPTVTPELAAQIRDDYGPYQINQHSTNGATHRQLAEKYGIDRSAVQRVIAGTYDFDRSRRNSVVKLMEPWDTDRTWGAGFLSAAFDGEGHLTMRERPENENGTSVVMGFAQRDNAMAATVNDELDRRGYEYTVRQQSKTDCFTWNVRGGRSEIVRFLGSVRPPRLLDKFDPDLLGVLHSVENVEIVGKEYVGEQTVIAITTETGTFIAEGYASHNSEQRPSCEYFLGLLQGRGTQVFIPHGSDLLKATHLYGYEDTGPVLEKMGSRFQELGRAKETIRAEMAQHQGQVEAMSGQLSQLDGAMQEIAYWRKNWLTPTEYEIEVE